MKKDSKRAKLFLFERNLWIRKFKERDLITNNSEGGIHSRDEKSG